jgi:hypothetical protein
LDGTDFYRRRKGGLPCLIRRGAAARIGKAEQSEAPVAAGLPHNLFRSFAVPDVSAFKDFAALFGNPLLSYEFCSTPRTSDEICLESTSRW